MQIVSILLVPPGDMPPGSTSSSSSLAFLSSQLEEARDNQVKERPGQSSKLLFAAAFHSNFVCQLSQHYLEHLRTFRKVNPQNMGRG